MGHKFFPSIWVGESSWFLAKVDYSKKVSNSFIVQNEIFAMQLASQNLLQFWDLHRAQLFNQYLNRSTFMIFEKKIPSFEKKLSIMRMLISDVQFRIEFPNATSHQNLLHYWDLDRHRLFNQYLSRGNFLIFGKSGLFKKVSNLC